MNFWKKSGDRAVIARSKAAEPVQDARGYSGEYQLLYKYLRDRYANRLVLTFAEIEDLLGFALPEEARLRREWWGGTDPSAPRVGISSPHAKSWTLASRSATVNLAAQTVVFERHISTD